MITLPLTLFLVFSSEIQSRGGWMYSTYMNKRNEWMNDVIEEVIQQIFFLITSYACFLYNDDADDLTNWLLSAWTIQGQCSFSFIIGKVTWMKKKKDNGVFSDASSSSIFLAWPLEKTSFDQRVNYQPSSLSFVLNRSNSESDETDGKRSYV